MERGKPQPYTYNYCDQCVSRQQEIVRLLSDLNLQTDKIRDMGIQHEQERAADAARIAKLETAIRECRRDPDCLCRLCVSGLDALDEGADDG